MAEEEWEVLDPHKEHVEQIIDKMSKPLVNIPGPEDLGELEYKELNEELLAEYAAVSEKLDGLDKVKKSLRAEIIKLIGDAESAQRGSYVVFVKPESRASIDWEAVVRDELGEPALTDFLDRKKMVKAGKMTDKYVTLTESKRVDVKRV